jgi:hypothetical protein
MYTGAQINFGDLTPYLTYGKKYLIRKQRKEVGSQCGRKKARKCKKTEANLE